MRRFLVIISVCFSANPLVTAQSLRTETGMLLESSCVDCHDDDTSTGLNLTSIGNDLSDVETFRIWEKVFDRVHRGEMPPPSADAPNPNHVAAALGVLRKQLRGASLERQQRIGRVPARRLTKLEFGYTVRDLLLIDGDVTGSLPDEPASEGFDTVGATHRISALHLSGYLKAADEAFDLAFDLGPNPYRSQDFDFLNNPFMNAFHDLSLAQGGSVTRKQEDGVAMFIDADYLTRATNFGFFVHSPGLYRITSTVAAIQANEPVTAKLIRREPGGAVALLDAVELPPGEPKTIKTTAFLNPGDDFYLTLEMGQTTKQAYAELIAAQGAKNYTGPGIVIQAQNVQGPLFDAWPPASTTQLLSGLTITPSTESADGPFQLGSSQITVPDVARILQHIAPRAFRRRPDDVDIQPFLDLIQPVLDDNADVQNVLRMLLRSLLCSPRFLMFDGKPGELDAYALSSRLSYFLWKSLPDAELFALAENGTLTDTGVLAQQVERMLTDPKSDRFVSDFLGQWLRLYQANVTTPDAGLYPEYDELLGDAILKEPEFFFRELIDRNLSVTNLIDSDFAFVNSRLSRHYDLPKVAGQHFRRVALPDNSHRGGVLTQAAILKTTANGTVTSPVVRGHFVLANLLGTPPSPPPPFVEAIEPDTRGTTTLREQLVAHRNNPTCQQCHQHIDPPGFALENFDPIGGFRSSYRASGKKTYTTGPEVDASGVTADGTSFDGIEEFKEHLLTKQEQVARNLIIQLVVYSTGGEIQFADRDVIEQILAATRETGFQVRDLIHEVVRSSLFRNQ